MKILKIEEVNGYRPKQDSKSTYSGYRIKTEKDELLLLIFDNQNCCEQWGYACSDENFDDYIGADFIKYEEVYSEDLGSKVDLYGDVSGMCFLNIYTSRGKLDFAVYNAHNGHYGHTALLKVNGEIVNKENL